MALFDIFGRKDTPIERPVVPVLPKEIYTRGVLELQDVLAPSALEITSKQLNIGGKIARTFFVISYPRFLTTGWFAPIVNLDSMFDCAVHIHPIDTTEILRKFQKRVAEVESQISIRESTGLVRDPQLDTAYQDLESLRDQLQQAQEKNNIFLHFITIFKSSKSE
jgi:hypothetical protein